MNSILVFTLLSAANALQIMLKSQDWYCITVDADQNTKYDLDYLVTGLNPEQVDFEARQGNH